MNSDSPNTRQRLAEFLRQALDLTEEANALASEIVPFKQDTNAGIYSIELESSVGVAPFLIYHYLLESTNAEHRTGRELFEVDLKTLERAATIDSPGPRIMAHALAGDEAFILATTPATHRVLTGQDTDSGLHSDEIQTGASTSGPIRHEAATKLVEALVDANQLAAAWLAAIRSDDPGETSPSPGTDFIEFNEAETALALYVLDDRSIKDLLAVLNLMIESARSLKTEQNGNTANGVN